MSITTNVGAGARLFRGKSMRCYFFPRKVLDVCWQAALGQIGKIIVSPVGLIT